MHQRSAQHARAWPGEGVPGQAESSPVTRAPAQYATQELWYHWPSSPQTGCTTSCMLPQLHPLGAGPGAAARTVNELTARGEAKVEAEFERVSGLLGLLDPHSNLNTGLHYNA